MKKFIFISFILFYTIPLFSQWWVQGGNLIWPYGNVNISKGNLSLNSGYILSDRYIIKNDSVLFNLSDNTKLFFNDNGEYSTFYLHLDDHGNYSPVTFDINVEEGFTFFGPAFNINTPYDLILAGKVQLSGVSFRTSSSISNPPTASELNSIFGSKPNGFIGYLHDTANNKLYLIGSTYSTWFYILLPQAL